MTHPVQDGGQVDGRGAPGAPPGSDDLLVAEVVRVVLKKSSDRSGTNVTKLDDRVESCH